MSHTMHAEEETRLERINEKKNKADVTHPLEPLIMSIVKGFVDDDDLSAKLLALYNVRRGALTVEGRLVVRKVSQRVAQTKVG